eukprot:scaffold6248_cov121-Isochrysis_galbana.AAC.7
MRAGGVGGMGGGTHVAAARLPLCTWPVRAVCESRSQAQVSRCCQSFQASKRETTRNCKADSCGGFAFSICSPGPGSPHQQHITIVTASPLAWPPATQNTAVGFNFNATYCGLQKELRVRVEGSRWRLASFGWSPPCRIRGFLHLHFNHITHRRIGTNNRFADQPSACRFCHKHVESSVHLGRCPSLKKIFGTINKALGFAPRTHE